MLAVSSMVLSFSGCSDNNTNTIPHISEPTKIFPLKGGNMWVYHTAFLNNYGLETTRYDTIYVGDIINFKNLSAYKIILNKYSDSTYMLERTDGIYEGDATADSLSILLKYKYPCTKNDYYSSYGYTTTVVDTNESLTLPLTSKTFQCFHYQTVSKSSQVDEYLSPGIGTVQFIQKVFDSAHPNGIVILKRELLYYSLK